MQINITTQYTYFELTSENGKIVCAPPIADWAIKQDCNEVIIFYANKGARIEVIKNSPVSEAV